MSNLALLRITLNASSGHQVPIIGFIEPDSDFLDRIVELLPVKDPEDIKKLTEVDASFAYSLLQYPTKFFTQYVVHIQNLTEILHEDTKG